MNIVRLALAAALLSVPAAFAENQAEKNFNAAIEGINSAAGKMAASQKALAAAEKSKNAATLPPVQIDAAYAEVPRCEAALKKAFGAKTRDFSGALIKGFSNYGYSLVLLTTTDAFFYHEDCDICAAVERCELKTGKVSNLATAHSVGCADLAPFSKKGVVYTACAAHP